MIKATELRLGNWLYYENQMEYVQVVEIGYGDKWRAEAEEVFPKQEDCEPIPLAAEWLVKFGLIKGDKETDRNLFYASGAHSAIHSVSLSGGVMLHRAGNKMLIERHIDFVHQLQNLYFALTGEELTIKQ